MIRLLMLFIISIPCFAAIDRTDEAKLGDINLMKNGGAELGKKGWSESGGGSIALETSTIRSGVNSIKYTFSDTADYLSSEAVTIKKGINNCEASIYYKTTSTALTFQVYFGSNLIVSDTLPSTSDFSKHSSSFACADVSSQYSIRVTGGSASDIIYIDDAYVGENKNIGTVSQAEFYGSCVWAYTAGCEWTTGDTSGALTEFGVDTDCPNPTVTKYASTPATKVPRCKFDNLPPGDYSVEIVGEHSLVESLLTGHFVYAVSDGTTVSGNKATWINEVLQYTGSTLIGRFSYTSTQASVSFRPVASSTNNSYDPMIRLNRANSAYTINVYRYPSASEIVYKAGDNPKFWRSTAYCTSGRPTVIGGAGISDFTNCGGTGTLGSLINVGFPTVSLVSSNISQISFTASKVGWYKACIDTTLDVSDISIAGTLYMTDGSNNYLTGSSGIIYYSPAAGQLFPITALCGRQYAASVGSTVTFKIRGRNSGSAGTSLYLNGDGGPRMIWDLEYSSQENMPQIIGGISTEYAGTSKQLSATLNCDSSSAITSQDGNPVSAIGNISSGVCAVTLKSGLYTTTPRCSAQIKGSTLDTVARADATSATNVNIYCTKPTDGSALSACDVDLFCNKGN